MVTRARVQARDLLCAHEPAVLTDVPPARGAHRGRAIPRDEHRGDCRCAWGKRCARWLAGIEGVAEAEAGVDGCESPRSQRSEEREKRLRWRGSSVVGLKKCLEEASLSEEVRNEAELTRLSRFLLACGPPLEYARVRVSDDFDLGGLDMSAT